jgi:hypothetical protein
VQTNGSKRWGSNISIALGKAIKPDLERAVRDFLEKNPTPTDDEWHAWAEREGLDVHQAEAEAYALAGRLVKFLRGGRSKGARPEGVPDEEISMGIKIESEHTDDPEIQRKITYDHTSEFKGYNTALKRMEDGLKG